MQLRSFLAVVLAFALAPLAARADPAPKLAVYDLAVNGSVPATLGTQFAAAIATEMRALGGVDVVTGAPGLASTRDRDDAKAQNADYYVSGAVAQVGTKYSVICELVSVRTGLLVWSSTLQAATADDLHGQGALVRQVLFDRIGRSSFPAVAASPAPAAASPAAGAIAASTATAAPARAPATFAVVTLGGPALPSDRMFAQRVVLESIRSRGATAVTDAMEPQDLSVSGSQACMDTGAATVVGGTLATLRPETVAAAPASNASVDLQVYDCRTQRLYEKPLTFSKSASISSDAIRSATEAAMTSYFGAAAPAPHV